MIEYIETLAIVEDTFTHIRYIQSIYSDGVVSEYEVNHASLFDPWPDIQKTIL